MFWGVWCLFWAKTQWEIDVFLSIFWFSDSSFCHFCSFFLKWPSQGAIFGQISTRRFHLASLQAFLVFQLLWKSFNPSLFFHYIHWPKFCTDSHLCEAPHNGLANRRNHSRKHRDLLSCLRWFFGKKITENWLALSLLHVLFFEIDRSFKIYGCLIFVSFFFLFRRKKDPSLFQ